MAEERGTAVHLFTLTIDCAAAGAAARALPNDCAPLTALVRRKTGCARRFCSRTTQARSAGSRRASMHTRTRTALRSSQALELTEAAVQCISQAKEKKLFEMLDTNKDKIIDLKEINKFFEGATRAAGHGLAAHAYAHMRAHRPWPRGPTTCN